MRRRLTITPVYALDGRHFAVVTSARPTLIAPRSVCSSLRAGGGAYHMSNDRSSLLDIRVVLTLFFVAWAAFGYFSVYPGYIHQDTAEIFMWSQVGFEGGYAKHPPFLPWLFRAVDFIVPLDSGTIALLSAANLTLGAYAVWCIAKRAVGVERAPLALLLYLLSPFATWHAVKLNHNSILISLWPVAILYFLKFRDRPTLFNGFILGAAAGVAVLSKYYSLILLFAMAVLLIGPQALRLIRTGGAWLGVATFLLVMLPHVLWITAPENAGTVVTGQSGVNAREGSALRILVRNALAALPILIGFLIIRYWPWRPKVQEFAPSSGSRSDYRAVAWLFVIPYATTLLASSTLGLRGSPSWTMPVFSMLPIVLAGLLPAPDERDLRRVRTVIMGGLVTIMAASPAVLFASFMRPEPSAVEPRTEVAAAAERLWRRASGEPMRLIAGNHRYAMLASVQIPEHPRAWANFARVPFIPPDYADRHGFVALCDPREPWCLETARRLSSGRATVSCQVTRQRELWGRKAPAFTIDVLIAAPAGVHPPHWNAGLCEGM